MFPLKQLGRLARPPIFEDAEKNLAALLLHRISLAVGIGAALSAAVTLVSPASASRVFIPFVLLLAIALCLALLYRRLLRAASLVLIAGLWLLTTFSGFTSNGIYSTSFGVYVLVIISAAILLREESAFVFAALSILSGIGMVYAQRQNWLANLMTPQNLILSPEASLSIYATIFLGGATLIYVTARQIRAAFAHVRQNEKQLAERNRDLEHQIAERQKAEAERDRFFEISIDMLTIAGFDGYFKRLNPAFERTLGFTQDVLLGRPYIEFVHPDDVSNTRREIEKLAAGMTTVDFENRFLCKDGRLKWLSWNARAEEDRIYAIARDMTERKKAEQQRLELRLANEKAAFLTEFLGDITHDLKTPMSVIETSLYILERIQDPEKQRDKIQQIKKQMQYVGKYVQDIVTVSRLDYLPALNLQPIDINTLLGDIVQGLRPRIETKRLEVTLDLERDLLTISADRDQLQRALINLVENAVKYTPEAGKITLRTYQDQRSAIVEVADTGIGIRDADLPHIFERFYRTTEALSSPEAGTGLGLTITKKILDAHHFDVEVHSIPGQERPSVCSCR
jgi:PAS domain S-box-containing protein